MSIIFDISILYIFNISLIITEQFYSFEQRFSSSEEDSSASC